MTNQSNMPNKPSRKPQVNPYLKYSGMAFQMVAAIGLGMWGGVTLDGMVQFKFPIFTLVLSLLGLIAAMYFVIKTALNDK